MPRRVRERETEWKRERERKKQRERQLKPVRVRQLARKLYKREREREGAKQRQQLQKKNLWTGVAFSYSSCWSSCCSSCCSACCSACSSCSCSLRSSWQLNALIRVLSTSLADKHADTLNWVLRQQQQSQWRRQLQAPLLARPGQARRRLPFEVANEKLLPLEFLMPIKYADAAAAAEDAVPRRGLA